ncbi:arabinosyltransferase domain-containing protein [Nocardioides piscis]|uniref:Arabinofuranosyltransferase central domain-containing protein n=1 Tax=Nocardioides piscis TaxID=2714938 RepID=A0A6G7YEY3_9ACTN|nr:arabinosyltransferase domain-containing protein [Nocardioides piscis]QIK75454.1 hypothetical protein G7071_08390 [Nocardioides piscis]
MTQPTRLAALFALAALLTGVVFALVPSSFHRAQIEWKPTTAADGGSLPLTRTYPDEVEVFTTCDLVRGGDDGALLTAGTLVMALDQGAVAVSTTQYDPAARVELPPGSCDVHAAYRASTSTLALTAGDNSDEVRTPAPTINTLTTGDLPRVQRVEILTRPAGVLWSWGRALAGLLTLALATAATVLLVRAQRGRPPARTRRLPRHHLAPVDAAVALSLLGLTFIVPALLDDGWVLARTELLVQRHWFGNVFATSDAWLPQGFPHEMVLAALAAMGAEFIHLRLFMALCLTVAWVVLRTRVLSPVIGEKASRWPPVAATFLAFGGAWLTTIRAEPIVVLCGVVTLAALVSMHHRPGPFPVLTGLLSAGLAMTAHQTGWVCLGPTVLLLMAAVRAVRIDRRTAWLYGAAVLIAVATSAVALFLALDLRSTLDGARAFSTQDSYTGMFGELSRYEQIFYPGTTGARSFTVLLLVALGLTAGTWVAITNEAQRLLWLASLLWIGGLLLTSSKWPWHLGVYAVPATVFAALAAHAVCQDRRVTGLPGRALLLPLVVLAAGLTLTRSQGGWGAADLSVRSWAEFGALMRQTVWYVALAAALCLGVLADRRLLRGPSTVMLSVAIVFPLVVNLCWIALDAREDGWSFSGMNARQLAGDNACGVLDGELITLAATPLPTESPQPRRVGRALALNGFPHIAGTSIGPLAGSVPVWGTWTDRPGAATPDAVMGVLSGPTFSVNDAKAVSLWSAAGTVEGVAAEVVFTARGEDIERIPLALSVERRWSLHRVTIPEAAEQAYVVIKDETAGVGGWGAVSEPAIVEEEEADTVLASARAFVGPYEYTQYPCVNLPDLADGYWSKIDYLIRASDYFDPNQLSGLTRSQVACEDDGQCVEKLDYAMANVIVTGQG